MKNYEAYCLDTETTSLNDPSNVIELSIISMRTDEQKTWFIAPINTNNIELGALKVNGHKLEDLKLETKYGKDTYKDPQKVIIEVENWLAEDNMPTANRIIIAQNAQFDFNKLKLMWQYLGASDSFPFGRRILDTMQNAFMMDLIEDKESEGYSLSNLIKKYGIKNDKAHSAAADARATKLLFESQIADMKKRLIK